MKVNMLDIYYSCDYLEHRLPIISLSAGDFPMNAPLKPVNTN